MREAGFKHGLIVDGGFPAYQRAGYELAPRGSKEPKEVVRK